MECYQKNALLLREAVEKDAAIFPISRHRKEDGGLDVESNLKVWKQAMEPFFKTKLWEDGAPGYDKEKTPLQDDPYFVFVPAPDGTAARGTIVVAHGGGFSWRTGSEGVNVADYFHNAGFNTAILAYRLEPYTRFDAIADMQRAVRILRSKKDEWKLGEKIAAMGFSAGGMLSGNCATHPDDGNPDAEDMVERYSCRVDAVVVGYGAMSGVSFPRPFGMDGRDPRMGSNSKERLYLAIEKNIAYDTPPMFIWQTMSDDGRHGMCLAKALQDADVPYELHVFQRGVHGLAMADGHNDLAMDIPHVTRWGELCREWLEDLGF